jgi:hypothetical protein
MWANFVGLPHPTPKMDDWGMDANSFGLYPIASVDCNVDAPEFSPPLKHSDDGMQHESELPNTAILPYLSLIFSLMFLSLLLFMHKFTM